MPDVTAETVTRSLSLPSPFPHPAEYDPDSFARAAVVVPIHFLAAPRVYVVARSRHLAEHAGELGFPGGKPLSSQESLRDAAFRELREELGLGADDVRELGTLRPVPVITGKYLITPFVAEVHAGATPRVVSGEIEALVPVEIEALISGRAPRHAVRTDWRGEPFFMPHFRFGERVLYGASAFIFFELLARVAAELGVPLPDPVVEESFPWGDRYSM